MGFAAGVRGSEKWPRSPAFCGVPAVPSAGKSMSRLDVLAEGSSLAPNTLFVRRRTQLHLQDRSWPACCGGRRRAGRARRTSRLATPQNAWVTWVRKLAESGVGSAVVAAGKTRLLPRAQEAGQPRRQRPRGLAVVEQEGDALRTGVDGDHRGCRRRQREQAEHNRPRPSALKPAAFCPHPATGPGQPRAPAAAGQCGPGRGRRLTLNQGNRTSRAHTERGVD
jgi:hypothetical protein